MAYRKMPSSPVAQPPCILAPRINERIENLDETPPHFLVRLKKITVIGQVAIDDSHYHIVRHLVVLIASLPSPAG